MPRTAGIVVERLGRLHQRPPSISANKSLSDFAADLVATAFWTFASGAAPAGVLSVAAVTGRAGGSATLGAAGVGELATAAVATGGAAAAGIEAVGIEAAGIGATGLAIAGAAAVDAAAPGAAAA